MILDLLRKSFAEPTIEKNSCEKLAAIALLVEVAMADGSMAPAERETLKKAIEKSHGLVGDELEILLENAKREQRDTTSSYAFTRVINDEFSPAAKFELVHNMWAIAYADGDLDKYEEHAIRKLSELIHVPHSEFIRAKLLARPC